MSLGRRAGGPRGHQGSLRPAAAFAALAALLFALVSLLSVMPGRSGWC